MFSDEKRGERAGGQGNPHETHCSNADDRQPCFFPPCLAASRADPFVNSLERSDIDSDPSLRLVAQRRCGRLDCSRSGAGDKCASLITTAAVTSGNSCRRHATARSLGVESSMGYLRDGLLTTSEGGNGELALKLRFWNYGNTYAWVNMYWDHSLERCESKRTLTTRLPTVCFRLFFFCEHEPLLAKHLRGKC